MFHIVEFLKFPSRDCLYYNNIHSLASNEHPDYGNCRNWCQNDNRCGGFTIYHGVCYFKNKNCKNDLFKHYGRSTFLIQGKVKKLTTW